MSETKNTFGVGFRPQHYNWVTTQRPAEIDVFEIVSENFMGVGGRPLSFLDKLRCDYPVIMHGVGLSIGSKGAFDPLYLKRLKSLTQMVEPSLVSDHLSWGRFGEHNSHDLLPIAYSEESLIDIAAKLSYLQDFLGRRFFLENPSAYVAFKGSDYDEAGFFAELCKRTGAGLLLDLNNLYVNARNLGQNPDDYLLALRPEDVGYFHLAGHSDQGNVLVDTHDQPVPDSVWALYSKAQKLFPGKPSIVEWDDKIPEFPELLSECDKARRLSEAKSPSSSQSQYPPSPSRIEIGSRKQDQTYENFFAQILQPFGVDQDGTSDLRQDLPVDAAVGLKVYNHAYFLRLEEALVDTFPALYFVTEAEGFRYLLTAYLAEYPPLGSSLRTVGAQLAVFLKRPDAESLVDYDFGVALEVLGDIAALEYARSEVYLATEGSGLLTPEHLQNFSEKEWERQIFVLSPAIERVDCTYEILPTLKALDQSEVPAPPELASAQYVVYRKNFAVHEEQISNKEARLIDELKKGCTLMGACQALDGEQPLHFHSDTISYTANQFIRWAQSGHLMKQNA